MTTSEFPASGNAIQAVAHRLASLTLASAWLLAAIFVAGQGIYILTGFNSPASGEAHLLVAGLRGWEGQAIADGYLNTLPGSLLWPLVGSAAYQVGNESGARLLAMLAMTVTLAALVQVARNFAGNRAALGTALLMLVSAPVMITGHLALMEPFAVAGVALALWAISILPARDHRGWVVFAAVAMTFAALTQYRAAVWALPFSIVLLLLRGKRGHTDFLIFWFVFSLGCIIYFQAFGTQVVDAIGHFSLINTQDLPSGFATDSGKRRLILFWSLPVLAIAAAGVMVTPGKLRRVATVPVVASALWVGALLEFSDWSSSLVFPDLAIALLPVLPVAGALLGRSTTSWSQALAATALCMLAVATVAHSLAFDRSWANASSPVAFLQEQVEPGDLLLVNNRWPVVLSLYASNLIDSPGDVLDEAAILDSDMVLDFCAFTWFVTESGVFAPSPLIQHGANACGTYDSVYSVNSQVSTITNQMQISSMATGGEISLNSKPFKGIEV